MTIQEFQWMPASVGSMTQAQVLTYAAGTWSDSAVTYL